MVRLYRLPVLVVGFLILNLIPVLGQAKTETTTEQTIQSKGKKTVKNARKSKNKAAKKTTKVKKIDPKSKEMKFSFAEMKLRLKITKSKTAPADIKFLEVENRDSQSAVLKFATPQFAEEPVHSVPAILVNDFEGESSLLRDIQALEYANESTDGNREIGVPRTLPLPKGFLYFWITPSKSAANYYYLQHPREKKLAIRIGPLAGSVDKEFTIDWAGAKWSK